MKQFPSAICLVLALSFCLNNPAASGDIVMSTVPVGNAGNLGNGTFGAVAYDFRVGTYEVTNDQYAAFLGAKAVADPLGLYNTSMGSDIRGGITQSGSSGNFSYAAKTNMGNKPVNYVSWYDAIRFANWLSNDQGSGDTETGAYTLGALGAGGIPINGDSINRNANATWFLPSENESYKAAFYQPATAGGDPDNYWHFPMASNSTPAVALATSVGDISNTTGKVANYGQGADWNGQNGNVTSVGSAGLLSASFYGTYDQGGNVAEWYEELKTSGINSGRGQRGGDFLSISSLMNALSDGFSNPSLGFNTGGFRVARVPLPSLPGDYNGNGTVDAADYTVWRNNFGDPTEAALNDNGDGGGVTASDFSWWKQHYGDSVGSASGSHTNNTVPEPTALTHIAIVSVGMVLCVGRGWRYYPRIDTPSPRLPSTMRPR